jgi:predicted DNA-binding protein (UPF0251 family)
MARPQRCRRVGFAPEERCFRPCRRCAPGSRDQALILGLDELEALRLADIEGLYQEQVAEAMNVSRQTLGRILESAHRKVAQLLVEGKTLRIEGGKVEMSELREFKCLGCGHVWAVPYGAGRPAECPECKSETIRRVNAPGAYGAGRAGQGRAAQAGQ